MRKPSRTLERPARVIFACVSALLSSYAQSRPGTESVAQAPLSFALTDPHDLVLTGGKAEAVEYQGRRAMRLTTEQSSEEVFAFLKGVQIQDGTIDVDIALKTTTPPGVRMPGFAGIAFRVRPDASHYEMFYLRPGNSHAEDQAMRNHSVQYVAAPGYDWYTLRREWPWLYESYAELQPETWQKVKVEVHGRNARLFINGSPNPSLIVNGLKGEDLQGGIALWGYAREEACFSNLRIVPAAPEHVVDGGEAAGGWDVEFSSDYGKYKGSMDLQREGDLIKGVWSGDFGQSLPVRGTWRHGYLELTFNGIWPVKQQPATAVLAGWIDGDAAKGRMKVEGRADGQWTAQRKR